LQSYNGPFHLNKCALPFVVNVYPFFAQDLQPKHLQ